MTGLREAEDPVTVTVTGFKVYSFGFDREQVKIAADEIASRIGDSLASLGTSCEHGTVDISIAGIEATS